MTSRCRSWSYRGHRSGFDHAAHAGHLPGGKCRTCWRPCRNRLSREEAARGARRCEECVSALLYHPDAAIRRSLLEEPRLERSILVALSTDASGSIALAASRRLEGQTADPEHELEPIPVPELEPLREDDHEHDLPPSRYDGSRPQPASAAPRPRRPKNRSHL